MISMNQSYRSINKKTEIANTLSYIGFPEYNIFVIDIETFYLKSAKLKPTTNPFIGEIYTIGIYNPENDRKLLISQSAEMIEKDMLEGLFDF